MKRVLDRAANTPALDGEDLQSAAGGLLLTGTLVLAGGIAGLGMAGAASVLEYQRERRRDLR